MLFTQQPPWLTSIYEELRIRFVISSHCQFPFVTSCTDGLTLSRSSREYIVHFRSIVIIFFTFRSYFHARVPSLYKFIFMFSIFLVIRIFSTRLLDLTNFSYPCGDKSGKRQVEKRTNCRFCQEEWSAPASHQFECINAQKGDFVELK